MKEAKRTVIRVTVHGKSGSLVDHSINPDSKTPVPSSDQITSLAEELHRIKMGRIAGGHHKRKK